MIKITTPHEVSQARKDLICERVRYTPGRYADEDVCFFVDECELSCDGCDEYLGSELLALTRD